MKPTWYWITLPLLVKDMDCSWVTQFGLNVLKRVTPQYLKSTSMSRLTRTSRLWWFFFPDSSSTLRSREHLTRKVWSHNWCKSQMSEKDRRTVTSDCHWPLNSWSNLMLRLVETSTTLPYLRWSSRTPCWLEWMCVTLVPSQLLDSVLHWMRLTPSTTPKYTIRQKEKKLETRKILKSVTLELLTPTPKLTQLM